MTGAHVDVHAVLDAMAVAARRVRVIRWRDDTNANWHVWPADGERAVLRCYDASVGLGEIRYEHAVLRRLASAGWTVPAPLGDPVDHGGRWYALTAYVPGRARTVETARQRHQRGVDLARLHVAMRELGAELGQRPGWRPQHTGITVHVGLDWEEGLAALDAQHPRLAAWADAAATAVAAELASIGAADLPVTLVHGDFASWNVHYDGPRLAGVIDFGLCHLDSRPYELAIARTYRAPEMRDGYRDELARRGWPLDDLEERSIEPIDRAFRVDMVAWQLRLGLRKGSFDAEMIERQLQRALPRADGPRE